MIILFVTVIYKWSIVLGWANLHDPQVGHLCIKWFQRSCKWMCITKDNINMKMKLWKLMKNQNERQQMGEGVKKQHQPPRKRTCTELSAEVMEGGRWQCVSDHRYLLLRSLHMKSLTIGPSTVQLTTLAFTFWKTLEFCFPWEKPICADRRFTEATKHWEHSERHLPCFRIKHPSRGTRASDIERSKKGSELLKCRQVHQSRVRRTMVMSLEGRDWISQADGQW